jgi:hypothetical protein
MLAQHTYRHLQAIHEAQTSFYKDPCDVTSGMQTFEVNLKTNH